MQKYIIDFLKKHSDYISGEEISGVFKISRAAIWKYIHQLRLQGYDIVAVPHLGYKLVSCPDKLFSQEIQYELGTKIFGKKIFYEESLYSTMDTAFRLAVEGMPEGTVVCAETQTKGRGRLGRHWISPKGKGIYTSIILRPKISPMEVAKLTLLTGVAVAEAIAQQTQLEPRIKWPNDVLINRKKVVGILTEMNAEMDRIKYVIVGIGINVNTPANILPKEATSLKQEGLREFSRVKILQQVLREMEKWYLCLAEAGFDPILERWKELSCTLKGQVRLTDPKEEIVGEAIDIDKDGGLMIRTASGIVVRKMAGDVIHVH